VNAVYYNKIMELPESERAAYVQEKRQEYVQDVDIYKLASEMLVDGIVAGSELRSELVRRLAYAQSRQLEFPALRNPVSPVGGRARAGWATSSAPGVFSLAGRSPAARRGKRGPRAGPPGGPLQWGWRGAVVWPPPIAPSLPSPRRSSGPFFSWRRGRSSRAVC